MKKSLRHPARRPTHPGAILREDVLPALGMSQTEFAQRLGVSRLSVSELLLEKRAMTTAMAARLGKLLGTSPETWINMQTALDLWKIAQQPKALAHIKPIRKSA
ncbi:MAG TPA: HigA family addiction module antitoxin [Candidatus Acidoferrum sp.]|nr:HigA family addiction module antitoxin [Candidatus Acidoferrum sp.]